MKEIVIYGMSGLLISLALNFLVMKIRKLKRPYYNNRKNFRQMHPDYVRKDKLE